jgi:hypothetical protein
MKICTQSALYNWGRPGTLVIWCNYALFSFRFGPNTKWSQYDPMWLRDTSWIIRWRPTLIACQVACSSYNPVVTSWHMEDHPVRPQLDCAKATQILVSIVWSRGDCVWCPVDHPVMVCLNYVSEWSSHWFVLYDPMMTLWHLTNHLVKHIPLWPLENKFV